MSDDEIKEDIKNCIRTEKQEIKKNYKSNCLY